MTGRGFAALTPEERRANARKAGKASQATGHAHRWTSDTAREAQRKSAEVQRKRASDANG